MRHRAGGIPASLARHAVHYSDVISVDPDDDSLMRYVIWHYHFDVARRERRNVTVAAYDNESEYNGELQRLQAELLAPEEVGLLGADPSSRAGRSSAFVCRDWASRLTGQRGDRGPGFIAR